MTDTPIWLRELRLTRRAYLAASALCVGGIAGCAIEERDYRQALAYAVLAAFFLAGYSWTVGLGGGIRDGLADGAAIARAEADAEMAAQRQQEAAARTPCEIAFDAYRAFDGEGYLYVLKFSTGVVKVGQTLDARRRLGEHRRDAGVYDVAIVRYWISPAHMNYLDNEIALLVACSEVAVRAKREYFLGIDFDAAVDLAHELTYYTDDPTLAEAYQ